MSGVDLHKIAKEPIMYGLRVEYYLSQQLTEAIPGFDYFGRVMVLSQHLCPATDDSVLTYKIKFRDFEFVDSIRARVIGDVVIPPGVMSKLLCLA